jgi:hypothetical protein
MKTQPLLELYPKKLRQNRYLEILNIALWFTMGPQTPVTGISIATEDETI